jgi:hypothetical protein
MVRTLSGRARRGGLGRGAAASMSRSFWVVNPEPVCPNCTSMPAVYVLTRSRSKPCFPHFLHLLSPLNTLLHLPLAPRGFGTVFVEHLESEGMK